MARIQAGDRDAFAALYTRYFDRVYSYIRLALRDHHAAEDVAQQVFLRVFQSLPRYQRRQAPFRAWLFTIVRHRTLSELERRQRVELTDPDELQHRVSSVASADQLQALSWLSDRDLTVLIERLPLIQRQVLVLRYLLDLSHRDIAAVLGRSPENVRILQYRAQQFLRERLYALGRETITLPREPCRGRLRQAVVLRSRRLDADRGLVLGQRREPAAVTARVLRLKFM